jgi:hypothetical protein
LAMEVTRGLSPLPTLRTQPEQRNGREQWMGRRQNVRRTASLEPLELLPPLARALDRACSARPPRNAASGPRSARQCPRTPLNWRAPRHAPLGSQLHLRDRRGRWCTRLRERRPTYTEQSKGQQLGSPQATAWGSITLAAAASSCRSVGTKRSQAEPNAQPPDRTDQQ